MGILAVKSLKVCIVSHIFHPDELGGAALFSDLALYLKEQGATVKVVSTFPYYPRWKLAPQDVGIWRRDDDFHGIPVRRCRMYVPAKASTVKRLLSDISFFFSLLAFGRHSWHGADIIITTCPMFGQTLAMSLARPFHKTPKMVVVQDFVVDAALELGMVKNKILATIFRRLERFSFRASDTLTTISDEMLAKLKDIAGHDRHAVMVPNWIHGSLHRSIEARRSQAPNRKQGFLFYSGNVGRKQGLPEFLESYKGEESGWHLCIHGNGAEFETLRCEHGGRSDVSLHGLQDENAYIDKLLSVSACLITQKPGMGANFLPSKILPALATGTPILAICERNSPLGREVIEAQCGEVIEPGDGDVLNETLARWKANPDLLFRYGNNAFARSERFGRRAVLPLFEDEIRRLTNREPRIPTGNTTSPFDPRWSSPNTPSSVSAQS